MTYAGRASIQANYVDFAREATTPLLLPTPEPQYLFAQMAMAGRYSLAALNSGYNSVEGFMREAAGGADLSPEMGRLARVADMYPDVVRAVDSFGQNEGDTLKFQRLIHDVGGLTKTDRELIGNSAISTTGRSVKTEEVPVTLKEYHGPYASGGSGVAPFEIKNFDAQYRANKIALKSLVNSELTHDYTKWLDTTIRDEFRRSSYTTLPNSGWGDVTSFVAGGGGKFSMDQWLRARKTLTDREWRPFTSGRYVGIVPTSFNVDMAQDYDYSKASRFHEDGRNLIFGYIGSLQDIDFFECSTTKQYAAASTVAGDKAGTVPAGVTLEEGLLIGPGAVGFGTAGAEIIPGYPETRSMGPVVRFSDDTNFGTLAKCIWYAVHAMDCIDHRGVQRVIAQSA